MVGALICTKPGRLSYIWKHEKQACGLYPFESLKIILDTFFYQIRTEQIINFRPNETLFNSIEGSDGFIKEMDKVEDKVLKWTQAAEETSAKRK